MNILIPTLMLWAITNFVIRPLAVRLTLRQLQLAGNADIATLNEGEKGGFEKVLATKYILLSVVILGIVGFVAGLLGSWFIGISLDKKGWPGMIAFILGSFLGFATKGGAV